jgi:hypothetical protein
VLHFGDGISAWNRVYSCPTARRSRLKLKGFGNKRDASGPTGSGQELGERIMKRFLLATVALVALAAPAAAADLAARPYTKAPPPVIPIYDWTGFYIGANGGWGTSRKCWDLVVATPAFPATLGSEGCHDT